jgi:hypothetical protein
MKIIVAAVLCGFVGFGCKSEKDIDKEIDKALAELDKDMKKGLKKGGGGGGSEAQVQLNKIGKQAKVAVMEKAAFPTGKVGPTPATDCCASGGKCKPDAQAWADATWKALEFSIEEPHAFQYSYESDGKTFTAKAIGCGDNGGTWTANGVIVEGNPKIEISGP